MKIKYQLSHGGRETHVSVQFKKDRTNDCSVRAIANAIYSNPSKPMKSRNYSTGYEIIRDRLFEIAKDLYRMPNDDVVVERFFQEWIRIEKNSPLTHHGKKKYQIGNFPLKGTFVIRCSNHWTCIKDGIVLDNWDCREWKAQSFYVLAGGE